MAINPAEPIGAVPYLSVDGASDASELYQRALGAKELARMGEENGKRLMHCHLDINGGSVMLSDFFEEHGYPKVPVSGVTLHLQVGDIEAWWKRAVDAGFEVTLPYQKMFWGDLYGQLRDKFGVSWSMGQTPKA